MPSYSRKAIELNKRKQIRLRKKEQRAANILKDNKLRRVRFRLKHREHFRLLDTREEFRRGVYRRRYNEKPKTVYIEGDFGIEESSGVDYFFEKAYEIIDFDNRKLVLDLSKCTRIWPSAITLLCSLKRWVELSTQHSKVKPVIGSSASQSDAVNSYLKHCGFYEYVNRPSSDVKDNGDDKYSDEDVVKIRREGKSSNIELREDEVINLLKTHSSLDEMQISLFNCIVLTEIFLNVSEHGVNYLGQGWWILAQHHKRHGFISLCIADNGIGVRNILMTGPQRQDIDLENDPLYDDKFIQKALTDQVSGAIMAPLKTRRHLFVTKKYQRGSHRGNGLKRIKDTCKKLLIPFAIISHNGYVFVDKDGNISKSGSSEHRAFAGTLHHFLIPAKRETA